jgi:hypothetical protein
MNAPAPVDVNRLRGILGKSKNLMDVVESGNFESGNIDSSMLVQETVEKLPANATPRMSSSQSNMAYTPDMVNNSRLPESIKKAMLESPTPTMTMNHTFSLEDVGDLVEKPMPAPQARQQAAPSKEDQLQQLYEQQMASMHQKTQQSPMVNEDQLRQIVRDELLNILAGEFTKKIRESAIKSTIQTLISEGKITTRKKTRT